MHMYFNARLSQFIHFVVSLFSYRAGTLTGSSQCVHISTNTYHICDCCWQCLRYANRIKRQFFHCCHIHELLACLLCLQDSNSQLYIRKACLVMYLCVCVCRHCETSTKIFECFVIGIWIGLANKYVMYPIVAEVILFQLSKCGLPFFFGPLYRRLRSFILFVLVLSLHIGITCTLA